MTATFNKPTARLALGLALLLLGGCTLLGDADDLQATVAGKPRVTFDALRAKDPQAEMGAREHPRILKANGGAYRVQRLEDLLAPIAGALVTVSDDPERAYDITVLNSPTVNAFALPGGYLYVTRGLLALANDESEVAAVLAHEIAHVTSNHGIERSRLVRTQGIAQKVVSDVVTNPVAGKKAEASVARRMASFSQEQELQADAVGIKMLARAGYDPFAAARFLESMDRYARWRASSTMGEAEMNRSHPSTPRRIELARRHARALGPPTSGKRNRERFLKGIDGLLYGDTAKEGFVRGDTFAHQKLGIAFSVPAGFELTNKAEAVLASGPNETALRFDAVSAKGKADPVAYLKSGWVNGLIETTVQATTINGLDAATGRALAGDWQFHVTVINLGQRTFRFIMAAPKAASNVTDLAEATTASFRQLSKSEVAGLKPLRVRVITVKPGDTLASLAAKMQGVSRRLDLFRALNAFDSGERPKPGQKVKIIVG